jgi:hypothetical protein
LAEVALKKGVSGCARNESIAIVRVFRRDCPSDGYDVVFKNFHSVQKEDDLVPVGMEQFFTFLLGISEGFIVDPYIAAIAFI